RDRGAKQPLYMRSSLEICPNSVAKFAHTHLTQRKPSANDRPQYQEGRRLTAPHQQCDRLGLVKLADRRAELPGAHDLDVVDRHDDVALPNSGPRRDPFGSLDPNAV